MSKPGATAVDGRPHEGVAHGLGRLTGLELVDR